MSEASRSYSLSLSLGPLSASNGLFRIILVLRVLRSSISTLHFRVLVWVTLGDR